MNLGGNSIIAGVTVLGTGSRFSALMAETGKALLPPFQSAGAEQVELALAAASAANGQFAASSPLSRAILLETIAETIVALGEELIARAMQETGLPRPRLEGERMRTANQLRMFATMLREGEFARVRLDRGNPNRPSVAKPDLRLAMYPLGPVAVFGASNFPLAFSVAGGDTASALAAGCPVIVKGHPAHPGTAELVGSAVTDAVRRCGFDAGIFSLLQDGGIGVGELLAADPRISAIGFTGSRRAGEALIAISQRRARPIPVYAEMSATNPVVLLPHRLDAAAEEIAGAFVASLTLSAGQFCTNPGLIIALEGASCDRFVDAAAKAINAWTPGTMLTPSIGVNYERATALVENQPGVAEVASSASAEFRARARLFEATAATFLANPKLHEEMFGPAALVIRCADFAEMLDVFANLEGQLTVAIHFDANDDAMTPQILDAAMRKAGRVLANGFGTGVEVSPAMVHGGPWPATSDGRSTSVGTMAVERFQRPVCLQDFPEPLLPAVVRDTNPWCLPRREWR